MSQLHINCIKLPTLPLYRASTQWQSDIKASIPQLKAKSAQSHNLFLIQYTYFNKCTQTHQNLKDQDVTGQKRLSPCLLFSRLYNSAVKKLSQNVKMKPVNLKKQTVFLCLHSISD